MNSLLIFIGCVHIKIVNSFKTYSAWTSVFHEMAALFSTLMRNSQQGPEALCHKGSICGACVFPCEIIVSAWFTCCPADFLLSPAREPLGFVLI